ncbi:hypothetical protein OH807_18535 [Kitasatospora sp. NBC_01560]|uniref:hypothetical protein n=1 Tax=Kitasatospora sp. NBC_01560 TaxID=2975965 RepID=UPI00386B1DA7
MTDGPCFEVLRLWAGPKLRGVPFADGVPLLPLDDALDRIAAELPRLGGPCPGDPSVERLVEVMENTARRLRRTDGNGPRPVLLAVLAGKLEEADHALGRGQHRAALDLVRRVCVMIVCLDEIATHTAGVADCAPGGGRPWESLG